MSDADGIATVNTRGWLDAATFALLTAATASPLLLPLQTIAQVALSALIGATALSAWLWQRRTRVSALKLSRDRKRLRIRSSDGAWLGVIRVDTGVIGPSLISARLLTDNGRTLTLFLPRWALAPEVHQRLCRMLLVGGRLAVRTGDQPSRAGGT